MKTLLLLEIGRKALASAGKRDFEHDLFFDEASKVPKCVPAQPQAGFTLIEMLVVIAIIAILGAISTSVYTLALTAAQNLQARTDLNKIVVATEAFNTEYGKYPLGATYQGSDTTFGESVPYTSYLMDVLRADGYGWDSPTGTDNLNPRRIVFTEWPVAKSTTAPKSGIGPDGQPYDPWGRTYIVELDGNLDNNITNPYTANAGSNPIEAGVIGWSFGKDGKGGAGGDKNVAPYKDDIISWQ